MTVRSRKGEWQQQRVRVSEQEKTKTEDMGYAEETGLLKTRRMEETDQESGASSEEVDSPRSVTRFMRERNLNKMKMGYVHNQILRIREEESLIGEEYMGEVLGAKDSHGIASPLNIVIISRPPILPSSPLRGRVHPVHPSLQ